MHIYVCACACVYQSVLPETYASNPLSWSSAQHAPTKAYSLAGGVPFPGTWKPSGAFTAVAGCRKSKHIGGDSDEQNERMQAEH